jgi:hypothetical protein
MAAKIRHYRPDIRIIVRHSVHIEQQLGDIGSVTISKSIEAPCGEFSITFPDHPFHNGTVPIIGGPLIVSRRSLYDILDILDPIEIQMKRWQEEDPTDQDWVTVLRGFVRAIGRNEEVGGDGRVQRSVVIAGQDCGAAFLMEQLGQYISIAENPGNTSPTWMKYLQEFDLSPTPMALAPFVWDVAESTTKDIMATAGWAFTPLLYVEKGYALPWVAFSSEGSVWELMKRYSAAPWNELFVREGKKSPELVFRPTPWADATGRWLPDTNLDSVSFWEIPMRNIIALSAHRDDVDQVQHVFVQNANDHLSAGYYVLLEGHGNFNEELRPKFGDRIQTVQEFVGPATSPMSLPEQEQEQAYIDYHAWLIERTEWLVKAGQDVYKLEKGSITIKGDPHIRVGDYISVQRGAIHWTGYVVGVSHKFAPYKNYLTTIDYIRSDQWIQRQKVQEQIGGAGVWDLERKQEA